MTSRLTALTAVAAAAIALGGCNGERKATAQTGTAEATVKTEAPANQVSASELQQQAQAAATAASTPVAGAAGNVTSTTTTSNTAH